MMITEPVYKSILLASHGTEGARAAELEALRLVTVGSRIHHLIVVPDFWKGMMGDDWLNNASTRDTYGKYLETELGREIDEHTSRLRTETEGANIQYSFQITVGKPEQCLIKTSQLAAYDIIIMGSPRPKGKSGLRSRMKMEPLVRSLTMPLLIVPFPDE